MTTKKCLTIIALCVVIAVGSVVILVEDTLKGENK